MAPAHVGPATHQTTPATDAEGQAVSTDAATESTTEQGSN